MAELKSCPFCGNAPGEMMVGSGQSWVRCRPCGVDYVRAETWNKRAAPSPAAGANVPEGWQLVPVEPTREMWAAVNKLDDEMAAGGCDGYGCTIEQTWNCMLAAAPTHPEAVRAMGRVEKDAARYRWRRDNPSAVLECFKGKWRIGGGAGFVTDWHDSQDAAIDAAMTASKGADHEQ